ncbi:tyrosine-type recombinase/integrase [Caminibacter pacificus]|uniref:Integrase/recombinase XerD n=1 Tax=Caminibacter pacificus TaxID=1424653 RepID=A0AAJ4RAM8_9BACT|nr:tyrosine-type recombinase/integrase [Caminibacter pacificus]QDD68196.1 site-specific integrase [Caminibacter pacificus]ROR38709.1 integrase/recombinase XerD [Caminibacter pacificus]
MPRFNLNAKDNIHDTLFFWLQQYTKFKAMILSLKNANEEQIKTLIKQIEYAKNFKELHEIMKKSKHISSAYEYFIKNYKFTQWLIENNAIEKMEDIDTFLVIEFLTQITANKSKSTMENYKNAVINFLKFIEDNLSLRDSNFSFKLKVSKWQSNLYRLKDKKPDYLCEEEIDRLLETIEQYEFKTGNTKKPSEYLKALYRLTIQFALFGGLRISEIANLKLKDIYINKKDDIMEVFIEESKNQKSRVVSIPYSKGKYTIKKAYEEYLEKRKDFLNSLEEPCELAKEYLIITNKCKKISSQTMENILKKLFLKAGILTTKKGMHLLRHTHASLFYKKMQDVLLLKERLGHDNIRTTMRYTHLDEEKMKKSADAMR